MLRLPFPPDSCVDGQETADDRRTFPRAWLKRGVAISFVPKPSFRPEEAIVPNVSRSGLGLVTLRPVAPGTVVALLFASRAADAPILFAEVKHAERLQNGCWLVGCDLSGQLSEAEVGQLTDTDDFPERWDFELS